LDRPASQLSADDCSLPNEIGLGPRMKDWDWERRRVGGDEAHKQSPEASLLLSVLLLADQIITA